MVLALLPLLGATGGCVARTAWDVATLPVKAGGKVVDWSTTSQEEADRNRGRAMRKQEKRERKERAEYDRQCRKHPDRCGSYGGPQG
jgi:hypothetical protein